MNIRVLQLMIPLVFGFVLTPAIYGSHGNRTSGNDFSTRDSTTSEVDSCSIIRAIVFSRIFDTKNEGKGPWARLESVLDTCPYDVYLLPRDRDFWLSFISMNYLERSHYIGELVDFATYGDLDLFLKVVFTKGRVKFRGTNREVDHEWRFVFRPIAHDGCLPANTVLYRIRTSLG